MKKSTKLLLIVGVIIIVLFLGYFIIKWNGCIGCHQDKDFNEKQEQMMEQIKEQLLYKNHSIVKKLSFPSSDIQLEHGRKEYYVFGVHNILTTPLNFGVKFDKEKCPNNEVKINFLYNEESQLLNPKDSLGVSFEIETESNESEICISKLLIINLDTDEIYAEEAFFVRIN